MDDANNSLVTAEKRTVQVLKYSPFFFNDVSKIVIRFSMSLFYLKLNVTLNIFNLHNL